MRSKEILFLKSLQNFSDLYNSRVDLVNGIYALPLSNVNYENHSKNIDNIPKKDEYISDETFFYLNIFDHNG
ncbi:MAG: hypothetical protein HOH98_05055, partial [Flavobacteriaceae bacterium]|nr:hypothetical protein [Flavobacteriaceae bacterium]